ncbi:hypothetical protein PTTG_01823 [Puccinia triticina 1-1 BBBD Race 1]|uniref:Uncharacterized protein n=1 Tax=Puccinia triticina (isolate 1-1 / race 1 (BBBD)) TaxID=630390 RepID=A0A0C4EM34_PUCT1|nr:hypothetical protein PTTG_01823 [Puccinia triticina 1-1 BBBD Race 1]
MSSAAPPAPAMSTNPETTVSHTTPHNESMDVDPAPTGCALPAVALSSFDWTRLI